MHSFEAQRSECLCLLSSSTPWKCFQTLTDPAPERLERSSCGEERTSSGAVAASKHPLCGWWRGKGKGCLAKGRTLSQRQTLCHRHFCFCEVVLTYMKKIVCSDSILASLTLLVIAEDYLLLHRDSGVALYFSFLKTTGICKGGELSILLVIPLTLQEPAHLIFCSLCRFNVLVLAFG